MSSPASAEHLLSSIPLDSSDAGFVTADSFVRNGDLLYIAGGFSGDVDFDPNGPGSVQTSTCPMADGCSYVAAYDDAMQLVWFDLFYGTGESLDRVLVSRSGGGVYLLLDFSGRFAWMPDTTEPYYTALGASDLAFVALDAAGAFVTSSAVGTGGAMSLRDTRATESGADTIDFTWMRLDDPQSLGTDAFVSRLDLDTGALSIPITIEATDDGHSVALIADQRVDATGRYLCGQYRGTVDFDTLHAHRIVEAASPGGFVARYDASGALAWLATLSADSGSSCDGLAIAPDGLLWATGGFGGHAVLDTDGDPIPAELTSWGFGDTWLVAWDRLGQLQTTAHLGGPDTSAFPNRIESMSDGTLAITGSFIGTITNGFAGPLARWSRSDYGDAFAIVVGDDFATRYFGQIGFEDGYTRLTPLHGIAPMRIEAIAQSVLPLGGDAWLDYALPPEHALLHNDGTWASAYVRYDLDTMLDDGFDAAPR